MTSQPATRTNTETTDQPSSASVARYRKTRSGQWVICAPATRVASAIAVAGGRIAVTKADGTTRVEMIEEVGYARFDIDGVPHVYATMVEPAWKSAQKPGAPSRTHSGDAPRGQRCQNSGCDRWAHVSAHDSSGISGWVCHRCAHGEDLGRSFA